VKEIRPERRQPLGCLLPRPGDNWQLFIRIHGVQHYLWRAMDQDGVVLDILVQPQWDAKAAKRFFRRLLKGLQYVPRVIVTDNPRSYGVARRQLLPEVEQRQSRFERSRRKFTSANTTSRTPDATIEITWTEPKLPRRSRIYSWPLPFPSAPVNRRFLSNSSDSGLQNLAARDMRPAGCLIDTTWPTVGSGGLTEVNVTMPASGLPVDVDGSVFPPTDSLTGLT
jgi:hypothetical protein